MRCAESVLSLAVTSLNKGVKMLPASKVFTGASHAPPRTSKLIVHLALALHQLSLRHKATMQSCSSALPLYHNCSSASFNP